jgi:phosphoglycolate phosphatase (TIGR01487 family)
VLRALLTDIDGTLTGPDRRIHTGSVERIRTLVDNGIPVVLASGNTSCFMDAICRMIGTDGSFIAENGGVFRNGFSGKITISGDQAVIRRALATVQEHFRAQGTELDLYSPQYRYSDLAFARTVPVDEVRHVLNNQPVHIVDTGYAIHLQTPGISKGTALSSLAQAMDLSPGGFLAVGDSLNDIQMIKTAGTGVALANGHPDLKAVAQYVTQKEYGDGFCEAVEKYFFDYFRAR